MLEACLIGLKSLVELDSLIPLLLGTVLGVVVGFIPGMGVAHLVFTKGADATRLPLEMSAQSALAVFALTVAMCAGSGMMALRKLRAADPAEVF